MSCPFLAAAAASGDASNDASRPTGGCPFAKRFALLGSSPNDPASQRESPTEAAIAAAATDGTSEVVRKIGEGDSGRENNSGSLHSAEHAVKGRADSSGAAHGGDGGEESGRKAGAGRCPFGFDSAADGRMAAAVGPMSCVLCKALLFDPARCDPCKHVYCRDCIARFNDCPLCGSDVKGLLPDAALAHAVDSFITAHVLSRPAAHPVPVDDAAPGAPRVQEARKPDAPASSGANAAAADASATDAAVAAAAAAAAEREAEAARVEMEALDLDRASPGSFLFIHAMRAMQHGNLPSARARFALSASSLKTFLSPPSAAGPAAAAAPGGISSSTAANASGDPAGIAVSPSSVLDPAAAAAATAGGGVEGTEAQRRAAVSRLGAVLGSHADCCLLMSDVASAASSYQEAVDVLSAALPTLPAAVEGEGEGAGEGEAEGAAEEGQAQGVERRGGGSGGGGGKSDGSAVDDELCHALCVSLNKLGDLHYRANRLPEALALYHRALARRQHALARAEARGGDGAVRETASKAVDVAVSTAKVADAQQAVGQETRARDGFTRALHLLQGVRGRLTAAAAAGSGQEVCLALLEKVEATEAFLQQQLGAATGAGTAAAAPPQGEPGARG
ncbi:hypothetical protein CLOP_g10312 [Closterium sp. NIES-67]|nr:hypothetical protein CLOP_g10312 [Closterium sp. NIES-67]